MSAVVCVNGNCSVGGAATGIAQAIGGSGGNYTDYIVAGILFAVLIVVILAVRSASGKRKTEPAKEFGRTLRFQVETDTRIGRISPPIEFYFRSNQRKPMLWLNDWQALRVIAWWTDRLFPPEAEKIHRKTKSGYGEAAPKIPKSPKLAPIDVWGFEARWRQTFWVRPKIKIYVLKSDIEQTIDALGVPYRFRAKRIQTYPDMGGGVHYAQNLQAYAPSTLIERSRWKVETQESNVVTRKQSITRAPTVNSATADSLNIEKAKSEGLIAGERAKHERNRP